MACKLERSRQWAVRLMHEKQLHEHAWFVTLTYSDEHLPKDWSVDVRHFQKFMKRLRKRFGKVRYFHCGEYGEQYSRPHYHAILYGLQLRDLVEIPNRKGPDKLYRSADLEEVWKKGACPLGEVTFQSARYVAAYVTSKINGPQQREAYLALDGDTGAIHERRPPYATMSRRPGIGAGWFEQFGSDVFPRDEVAIDGHLARPPKFYDTLLEREDPALLESIKARRVRAANVHKDDNTYERLRVKEKVLKAKSTLRARDPNA